MAGKSHALLEESVLTASEHRRHSLQNQALAVNNSMHHAHLAGAHLKSTNHKAKAEEAQGGQDGQGPQQKQSQLQATGIGADAHNHL